MDSCNEKITQFVGCLRMFFNVIAITIKYMCFITKTEQVLTLICHHLNLCFGNMMLVQLPSFVGIFLHSRGAILGMPSVAFCLC